MASITVNVRHRPLFFTERRSVDLAKMAHLSYCNPIRETSLLIVLPGTLNNSPVSDWIVDWPRTWARSVMHNVSRARILHESWRGSEVRTHLDRINAMYCFSVWPEFKNIFCRSNLSDADRRCGARVCFNHSLSVRSSSASISEESCTNDLVGLLIRSLCASNSEESAFVARKRVV